MCYLSCVVHKRYHRYDKRSDRSIDRSANRNLFSANRNLYQRTATLHQRTTTYIGGPHLYFYSVSANRNLCRTYTVGMTRGRIGRLSIDRSANRNTISEPQLIYQRTATWFAVHAPRRSASGSGDTSVVCVSNACIFFRLSVCMLSAAAAVATTSARACGAAVGNSCHHPIPSHPNPSNQIKSRPLICN